MSPGHLIVHSLAQGSLSSFPHYGKLEQKPAFRLKYNCKTLVFVSISETTALV